VTRDHDGTEAVLVHETGRHAPELLSDPDEVIGILGLEERLRRVIAPGPARRGGRGAQTRMAEQIVAAVNLRVRPTRQCARPVHELDGLVAVHGLEPVQGHLSAVDRPVGHREVIVGMGEEVEHEILVVTHEDGRVGNRTHDPHDPHGIRTTIDHVTKAEDPIVLCGRDPREDAVERLGMTVDIREDVCGHPMASCSRRAPCSGAA